MDIFRDAGLREIGTIVKEDRGHGMLGIGRATGDGTAAKDGYQGSPGTLMVEVNASHAVPNTLAMMLVSFHFSGLLLGPPDWIKGIQGGPTTWPPVAVTPLMTTPIKVAELCHVAHAEQIASQIPSM